MKKLFYFLSSILFIISCKDDITEIPTEIVTKEQSKFSPIDTDSFLSTKTYKMLYELSSTIDSVSLESSIQIKVGETVHYTFPYYRQNKNTFENLYVIETETGIKPFKIEYIKGVDYYKNSHDLKVSIKDYYFPKKVHANSSFERNSSCEQTDFTIEVTCTGGGHYPGQNCKCEVTDDSCKRAYTIIVSGEVCGGSGSGNSSGENGGQYGDDENDGESEGGGGSSGGNTTPVEESECSGENCVSQLDLCLQTPDIDPEYCVCKYEEYYCEELSYQEWQYQDCEEDCWKFCGDINTCTPEDYRLFRLSKKLTNLTTNEINLLENESQQILDYLANGGRKIAVEIFADTKKDKTTHLNQNLAVDVSFTNFPRLDCVLQKMRNTKVMEDFINSFANDEFDTKTVISSKNLYQDPNDPSKVTTVPNGSPVQLPEGIHLPNEFDQPLSSEIVYNKIVAENDDNSSINIALILIHEMFHAYIYQKYVSAYNQNPTNPSYAFLFDWFIVNSNGNDHDQMTRVFRRKATAALFNFGLSGEDFDNLDLATQLNLFEELSDFAWKGLGANGSESTQAWENLSTAEKTRIESVITSLNDRVSTNQNLLTECD